MARWAIQIARVYDPPGQEPASDPGARLLADRLWPRGLSKAGLQLSAWVRDAAPGHDLRKWFHADPAARYGEFIQRYRDELAASPARLEECLAWCRKGPVLLLTAAHDPGHSHVPVLKDVLEQRLREESQQ